MGEGAGRATSCPGGLTPDPPASSGLSAYPSAALHHRLLPDPRCGRCSFRRAKGPGRTRSLDSARGGGGTPGRRGGGAGSRAGVPPQRPLWGQGARGRCALFLPLGSLPGAKWAGPPTLSPGPDAVGAGGCTLYPLLIFSGGSDSGLCPVSTSSSHPLLTGGCCEAGVSAHPHCPILPSPRALRGPAHAASRPGPELEGGGGH